MSRPAAAQSGRQRQGVAGVPCRVGRRATMARDPRITAIEGEITGLALDANVNAANSSLLGGGAGELLARCYRQSLSLAAAHGVRTIAFPAISSGAYGFPRGPACAIAVEETHRFLLT